MASKPLRVLIADDHPDLVETLSGLIEASCDCEVTTTVNGALALELALVLKPHAVILDIDMPVMDGLEAARALRAKAGANPPLLIALSGGTRLNLVRDAAVFDHVLAKPNDIVVLTTLLQDLESDSVVAPYGQAPQRLSPRGGGKRADLSFLAGGGQMGSLMRSHDWNPSGLGAPATW